MRLLDRYLLRELLIPLGFCLCGLLIFYIAFDLVFQLHVYQEKHLLVSDVAQLYLVRIPEILVFMLPIVLLLALLYALTNHARHHELTAIRAAGVSLGRLCAPYFAIGILLSLAVFVMNEYWVPDAADQELRILNRRQPGNAADTGGIVKDLNFNNSRDGHRWHIDALDLHSPDCAMTGLQVFFADGGTNLWLIAKRAAHVSGDWTFYDVQEFAMPESGATPYPLLATNVLTVTNLTETPDELRREARFASRNNKSPLESSEIPIIELLDYLALHPRDLSPQKARPLYTQLHGRLAAPWTCLVVVLIAIPFGAGSGRRNIFVGVAGSIIICFVYFVLLKLGLALGARGWLTPWIAAWLPNLFFGITGAWLMLRVR